MTTKKKIVLKAAGHLPAIRQAIRKIQDAGVEMSDTIGRLAEPPLKEFKSSRMLADFLTRLGFNVTWPWKKLPTAFRATIGAGRPRICLLAEYDALPDCGLESGQWGHGCGHNLLGVGAAMAGAAAAQVAAAGGIKGTIDVIGTPAEETLGGKVFIGEFGGFDGYDAAVAWHPGGMNIVDGGGLTAMDSLLFQFKGRTAHAASKPHEGRSALDGALLMDVAVNFLREHVEDNCRMHCVIVNGGKAPNVVPDTASIWYYIRGKDRAQVDALRSRVVDCAKGAALATGTAWQMDVLTCCTERLPAVLGNQVMHAAMTRCGAPKFTPADVKAARQLNPRAEFHTKIDEIRTRQVSGSSDEDNVSWFAPLVKFWMACVPRGTIAHHRTYAAMTELSGAHRGMLKAAETMSLMTLEMMTNAPLLKSMRAEFKKNLKGKRYSVPLSKRAIELSDAMAEWSRPK